MWIVQGLSAGVVLGLYDVFTKRAIQRNTVIPLVFWSSLCGALCWVPFIILGWHSSHPMGVAPLGWQSHLAILPKSVAMTASWVFAYYAVKRLSISIAGAVRASGPLWTLFGGMLIFGEFLSVIQYVGLAISLISYYLLSVVGRKESHDSWSATGAWMMLLATLLSALVTVYDKYLVTHLTLPSLDIQGWSAVQRCVLAYALYNWLRHSNRSAAALSFNWAVPLVGVSWVVAELIYFRAYADPAASVVMLAVFRRMSLVVAFGISIFAFHESNVPLKSLMIGLLILGTSLLIVGRS